MTEYPLSIVRGDSKSYQFTFRDASGAPVDITGWLVSMTVKANWAQEDAEAVVSIDVTEHIDPANGITLIALTPAAHTDGITPGKYYYDIQVKTAAGGITTIMRGPFSIEYDVTRRTT